MEKHYSVALASQTGFYWCQWANIHSLTMSTKRSLLRREITYSEAKRSHENVVHELSYPKCAQSSTRIYRRREVIAALVAHHLGVCPSTCQVEEPKKWMSGSFNLCVPVKITSTSRRLVIRFPLPYRVGDNFRPGNADEKVRCEAATYAWISQECPSIPMPHLYGFALSTGQLLVQHPASIPNETGPYLLMDFIEEADGRMLSDDWHDKYDGNRELRMNLFRSLAKVILTLSRKPLPKIGSFTIDNDGFVRLENRPLAAESVILENAETPLDIPRDRVYNTVDSYVNDLLFVQDNYLRHQPNGLVRVADCVTQMSALSMMRALSARFFERDLNHGPFYLSLTDLHASNIFVDENWNIKCLIDIEWAISQPLEFIQPPYWLTGETVDEISPDKYSERHEEFMEIFEEQEHEMHPTQPIQCSSVIKKTWDTGAFWYILALQSPSGLNTLFYKHIQPRFTVSGTDNVRFLMATYRFWTCDAGAFLKAKVEKKKEYNERLQQEFHVEDKEINEELDIDLDKFKLAEPALR
ncbi:hypothetical protein AJ79_05952 [Helicocarpus griseus UAMH5409]|uniref:Uncharacterized protein n=1 Tax=Helicocarpus griseus UAMH5409 TaxID=1447875 RepID=A0A2B7XIB2_9EURO|nr:hypothetical protein AJ79_05952 [Helicocarpus griseus UAMH5409]